jgi:alanine dehydrogenase
VKTLIVSHNEVKHLLAMQECIEVMDTMFREVAAALLPPRQMIWQPDKRGMIVLMPSYLGASRRAIGAKVVTVFPENLGSAIDSHQGAILLFETKSGRLLAAIDATSVTAIRTAAVSAVATRALARKDAANLAILGSGTQARSHLEAMLLVREVRTVKLWSRSPQHARRFSDLWASSQHESLSRVQRIPKIQIAPSAREAVEYADIICTTTSATQPILEGKWVADGAHINAVGAYTPTTRELDSSAVAKSLLFVDSRESAMKEAGDFLIPRNEGILTDSHIRGELGEVLKGKIRGRTSDADVTLFKSLGLATEDLAAAHYIYQKASSRSCGAWMEFTGERE